MTAPYTERPGAGSLVLWAAEAEAAAVLAKAFAPTAFIPDSLRVRDHQGTVDLAATVATVTAALLTGQELGLSPMASLRSIDVIPPGSGSPALRAAALRGLLQHHGHDLQVIEATDSRAVVRGRRAGSEDWYPTASIWTMDRAKRLGPRGFGNPTSSWAKQPGVMLIARATAEMARWIASDVILGLPYIVEEVGDPEDGEAGLPAAEGGESGPTSPTPRRRAPARRKAGAPLALAPPQPPAAEGQGQDHDAEQSEPAEPGDQPEPITQSQLTRLWIRLKEIELTEREPALEAVSGWVGREVTSSKNLTAAEADIALQAAEAENLRRQARAAAEDAQASAELGDELA